MKKAIVYISLMILFLGCVNHDKNRNATFDLYKDISNFSRQLENGDSLIIVANLSACSSIWIEKNTLIKREDNITIETYAQGDYVDKSELKKIPYNYVNNDSLNFENLFEFMIDKSTKDRRINSNIFTIIYQQDTIRYYSDGLTDHLENIDYYLLIKRRIYPNVKMYQPVIPPPKPKKKFKTK